MFVLSKVVILESSLTRLQRGGVLQTVATDIRMDWMKFWMRVI